MKKEDFVTATISWNNLAQWQQFSTGLNKVTKKKKGGGEKKRKRRSNISLLERISCELNNSFQTERTIRHVSLILILFIDRNF